MLVSFPELYEDREEIRMMYRATHIYILMSSLINLAIANYSAGQQGLYCNWLRRVASVSIIIAPAVFFVGFIVEPQSYLVERPFSFWGVLLLLVGVLLHTAINWRAFTKNGK
jgi:hypothetical protein